MARHGPRLAGAQHPWPGTRLHLFIDSIPTLLTRLAPPVENGGPCRGATPRLWLPSIDQPQATNYRPQAAFRRFPGRGRTRRPRSGAHAALTAKTPSPTSYRHELPAAGRPAAFTAHYEPTGRTHGSAPTGKAVEERRFVIPARLMTIVPAKQASPDRHTPRGSWKLQETMLTTQSPGYDF